MDPNDLYSVRQQFTLGGYKAIAGLRLPDSDAEDRLTTLLYHVRSHLALNQPDKALELLPPKETSIAAKAGRSLASYIKDPSSKDTTLEELRDMCVEIEGEDVEADEYERNLVRVLAGTAFALEGEVEEALETLGAGSHHHNLEASALIVHLYLTIHRPDLARKEYDRVHKSSWANDDLLLQHIEASIGLVSGKDSYTNPYSFFNEQLLNPSLSSNNYHLLLARGTTSLLKGEYASAHSDFEESLRHGTKPESLIGSMVAAGHVKSKRGEAEALWSRIEQEFPDHPVVADVKSKEESFDAALTKFKIPPPVTA